MKWVQAIKCEVQDDTRVFQSWEHLHSPGWSGKASKESTLLSRTGHCQGGEGAGSRERSMTDMGNYGVFSP